MILNSSRATSKRAFTLIELLVVIAIIAILAAILFPVFAAAREKAKQANCISNQKQTGLAVLQYIQDYDEYLPPVWQSPADLASWLNYCYGSASDLACAQSVSQGGPPQGFRSWANLIQPYMKTFYAMYCPSMPDPVIYPGQPYYDWAANWTLWPSYGWNYQYLSPPDSATDPNGWFDRIGVADAAVVSPAACVEFVDAGEETKASLNEYEISMVVDPPDGYTSPNTVGWGGWGTDWATIGSLGPHGQCDNRHTTGLDVTFVDGHVKWMTYSGLAVGSSWSPTATEGQVHITNVSQYLWDKNGLGG